MVIEIIGCKEWQHSTLLKRNEWIWDIKAMTITSLQDTPRT